MRCAVFTATPHGTLLARRIRAAMDGPVEIFSKEGQSAAGEHSYTRLKQAVAEAFSRYDALIFVMAAGIAVRMLAPHLVSKLEDPAVVVLDEQGHHVISLLSGHIGGANVLTNELAAALGAEPVITTATDVNGKLAADVVAGRLGLRPWPKDQIKVLNAGILQGEKLIYGLDQELERQDYYRTALVQLGLEPVCMTAAEAEAQPGLCAFITKKTPLPVRTGLLYLQPRKLVAGMGCRRGTTKPELCTALREACAKIGRQPLDVEILASTEVKRTETGLLALAGSLGREIRFFSNRQLQAEIERYGLQCSPFVEKTIGVGNVAEAAALCCVESGRIALGKTKFSKVTVALIWEK